MCQYITTHRALTTKVHVRQIFTTRACYLPSNLMLTSLSPTNTQTCCCDGSSTGVYKRLRLKNSTYI